MVGAKPGVHWWLSAKSHARYLPYSVVHVTRGAAQLPAVMTDLQKACSNTVQLDSTHARDASLSSDDHLEDGDDCHELHDALEGESSPEYTSAADRNYSPAVLKTLSDAYADSIFAKLVEYGWLKKVTDIVLAKVKIPWHLRDDAAQCVHLKWCLSQAKPEFQKNQLAFFAYLAGQHAALALRRELGAVCVLPGALFREGKQSAFMESIGAAVNPIDVDEYKDSMELSIEASDMMHLSKVNENLLTRRLGALSLSQKQMRVARMVLLEGLDASEIAHELDMRVVYVERLIKQVTLKLNNRDEGIVEPEVPKVKKAVTKAAPKKPVVEKQVAEKPKTSLGNSTLLRRRPVPRSQREALA